MRRLAVLAACGLLILSACRDETPSPTEPSVPEPEATFGSCQVTRFPIVRVTVLILKVFPPGRLRIEAVARAAAIALLWDTCRAAKAQKAAVDFVAFMNANSSRLIGTLNDRNTLIRLVLTSVGIPFETPPGGTTDYGVGIFDPANPNPTIIETQSGVALVQLDPGSFDEQTAITIARLGDGTDPLDFDGNQFPPFWDYNAVNASGEHFLTPPNTAIIGFCLFPIPGEGEVPGPGLVPYPPEDRRRIGHNIFGGGFEVLEPVDLAEDYPDLYAALVAKCGDLDPTPAVIGGFGQGLPGLANAAWREVGKVAKGLFLPEALRAATLGTLPPPIGGRAPSLSPFGVVEIEPINDLGVQFIGDFDVFNNTAADNTDNQQFYKNFATFTGSGPRATQTQVIWYEGLGSLMPLQRSTFPSEYGNLEDLGSALAEAGYTFSISTTTSLTNVPSNVKVLFIVVPTQTITFQQAAGLRTFVSEGGRLVLVSDNPGFYASRESSNQALNSLLARLGADARDAGISDDCGYVTLPSTSLRSHQLTMNAAGTGTLNSLTIACATDLQLGETDTPFMYNSANTVPLGAEVNLSAIQPVVNLVAELSRKDGRLPSQSAPVTSATGGNAAVGSHGGE